MALVFGRFDKAPEEVREALMDLVMGKSEITMKEAAMTIFDAAVDIAPDITSQDLSGVVRNLLYEGRALGFIGKDIDVPHLSIYFRFLIKPRSGFNGPLDSEERYLTLAEISAAHAADEYRQNRHQARALRR